jgi:hypothetical protein
MNSLREYIRELLSEEILTLHHRTSPDKAATIRQAGFNSKIKTSFGTEVYFSTKPDGEATGYGSELVSIEIPEQYANLDDEFPDGEQHYWVAAKDLARFGRLLNEDAMGFVHDLAAADSEFGEDGVDFFGGDPGKGGGRAIKRAFNANADHKWLSTLDTVHWTGEIYNMEALVGRGKDELSATMTLPGEDFDWQLDYGLWIQGRITLATNDQDQLYSGHFHDYIPGLTSTVSEEEYEQRKKSSGINKLPTTSKDYSRYGKLKRGNEYAEEMAKKIPYLLDQSMWAPAGSNNEALVDNWKPVGIILTRGDEIYTIDGMGYVEGTKEDIEEFAIGVTKQIMLTALAFGVPVYDTDRELLWSPK